MHSNTDELTKIFIKFCWNISFQFIWTYCGPMLYAPLIIYVCIPIRNRKVLSRNLFVLYAYSLLHSNISILAINEIQLCIIVMEISCVIFGLQLNGHICRCEMLVDLIVLFCANFQMNLIELFVKKLRNYLSLINGNVRNIL